MSIFSTILSKIFPSSHPAVVSQAPSANSPAPAPARTTSAPPSSTSTAATPVAAMPAVDVEAKLDEMGTKSGQPLNWRSSIVDLMKLLDVDSSLANRKALATELHYSGDANDSAAMNIWLHQQVMSKLASNGGKVPADLIH